MKIKKKVKEEVKKDTILVILATALIYALQEIAMLDFGVYTPLASGVALFIALVIKDFKSGLDK